LLKAIKEFTPNMPEIDLSKRPEKTTRPELIVVYAIIAFVVISTLISTILHHGYPHVLRVPSNEGIPMSSLLEMFIADLLPIGMAWMCFRHGWRRTGLFRAMIFLGGSFIFTGVEESMWILIGRYGADIVAVLTPAGGSVPPWYGTYYFTKGFFWFLETPVSACLGWFFIAYSGLYMAELVIPKAHNFTKAFLAGFLAMNIDLWLDPVMTSDKFKAWIWADQPGGIWLFSIPLTNFIGWFFLVFIFDWVYNWLPSLTEKRGPIKASIIFYGVLMVIEIAILLFFAVYGSVEQALFSPVLNLTIWGI
jgi:Carotenoid biosynthesis protein